MAANPYLYTTFTYTRTGDMNVGGVDTVVGYCENAAQAALMAQAYFGADSNLQWGGAGFAQELAASTDTSGMVFTVHIENTVDIDVSYTAQIGDTIDMVGFALVSLLEAAGIANTDYDDTTNVLTIAETTDNLGDKQVTVTATYAAVSPGVDLTSLFFSTLVDGGAANEALTVVLVAGVTPGIQAVLKT